MWPARAISITARGATGPRRPPGPLPKKPAARPAPRLDIEERRLLDKGVDEFDRGYYFECHDSLEEMWTGLRGPGRDFFQALIQVSVAFYHLGNENLVGAESMIRRALRRF